MRVTVTRKRRQTTRVRQHVEKRGRWCPAQARWCSCCGESTGLPQKTRSQTTARSWKLTSESQQGLEWIFAPPCLQRPYSQPLKGRSNPRVRQGMSGWMRCGRPYAGTHSTEKGKETPSQIGARMSPQATVLREIIQPQKNKDCRIPGYEEPGKGRSTETGSRWEGGELGEGTGVSVSRDRVSVRGRETALEMTVMVAERAWCPSCARKRGHDGGLTFVRYLL